MYQVTKRLEISAAHKLDLPYENKCENLHGHNWIIEVTVQSEELNDSGMVIDFVDIKEVVMYLDHTNLNTMMGVQPTAENIASWIARKIQLELNGEIPSERRGEISPAEVVKVSVQESEGNKACYIP